MKFLEGWAEDPHENGRHRDLKYCLLCRLPNKTQQASVGQAMLYSLVFGGSSTLP